MRLVSSRLPHSALLLRDSLSLERAPIAVAAALRTLSKKAKEHILYSLGCYLSQSNTQFHVSEEGRNTVEFERATGVPMIQ